MNQNKAVLLHGWGSSVEKLKPLKQALESQGWKVFLPKLPGSDAPEPDSAWDLDNYADYVRKITHGFFGGQKYYLFGHSFGGRIAIKLAARYPQEFKGVVLCAAGGLSRGSWVKRVVFLTLAKAGKVLNNVFPKAAAFYRQILYKFAREHDYEKSTPIMKAVLKNVINEDLKPLSKKISLPTLILWGDNDKMTGYKDALFLKRNINNSKLVTFKGQGHTLPYQKYEEISIEINKWISG